jgi:apolipoprotein N-acyltransferase
MGVAICYEVTYPWLYASEVKRGATLLVTVTNDGWYGDSAAPRQHLALAVLRAAETRRYLVRAANTGVSAIIDPYGRVVRRLEVGQEGFITAPVQPGTGLTPAVRLVLGSRVLLVLTALGAILCAVRRRLSSR